jgi:glycosyltransferase involved in cell wall biosynthesis
MAGDRGLRLAMIGTRGVPAAYGGFETAVEEIGSRLAQRGHHVTVYCRTAKRSDRTATHLGMHLVHLPAARSKFAETLSHTGLSVAHLSGRSHPDAAFVFNAANAPFLPWLRALRVPVAVHVDGLEWKRAKWSGVGKRYYRWAEGFSVRWADALIADASGIADYYRGRFDVDTELLTYGAKLIDRPRVGRLGELHLIPNRYHLVVARFEPENNVELIVDGYRRSAARFPLVVIGSSPYSTRYTQLVTTTAAGDPRVRFLGGVWDQDLLDQLYSNALTYLHGHSVGGTNPSLLRAMGAATSVLAYDVSFNREVLGPDGAYFDSPEALAPLLERAEADPQGHYRTGLLLQDRARRTYDWSAVALGYERLATQLAAGESIRHRLHHLPAPRHSNQLRPS